MSNQTTTIPLPPVWNQVTQHPVFPEARHDEIARFNFLANMNKYLSTVLSPGNKEAYEKRVRPAFKKEKGRDFSTRDEVREAMKKDPHYQYWSALRRITMEMRQQAGRSLVLRQIYDLKEKAEKFNKEANGSLALDPKLKIPHYIADMDNHCMPGSYHTELIDGDVSAAANYDSGLFVTTGGALGKLNDGGGKAVVLWLKSNLPDFKPKRILDIGCGLGHNALPIAQAYPDAEVIAIDLGAPMIRYGHARAKALGVNNIKFMQMNAEETPFEDASFDWVQSTMFLHETSTKAIQRIMKETHRLLRPEGLTLHVEQPQYTPEMDLYEQFIRDWDAYYNNEPFWGVMHEMDVKDILHDAGFKAKDFLHFGARAVNDNEDFTKAEQKEEVEDHGRAAVWNVFGSWKK